MGYISLFITLILVLGGGYYFLQRHSASFSVKNGDVEVLQENSPVEEAKEVVEAVEKAVEERAKEVTEKVVEKLPEEVKKTEEKASNDTENKEDDIKITNRLMSSGFAVPKSARKIDTVVLHSSYNSLGGDPYSVSEIVKIYESYEVSAHYIIDRNGKIYRLVEDKNISYHAGASKMSDGRQNVNDFSIGIELVNKMDTEYTKEQYEAVNNLVDYLRDKYPIKSVVGHSDIAPSRKTDPWNFDWKKLK